jgi:hypothetical protein
MPEAISSVRVAFLARAQATRAEVLDELGAPQEITSTNDRDVYRYRYLMRKTFRISFGQLTRGFVPVTISRGNTGFDVFEMRLDAEGTVQGYAFKPTTDQARFNPWPF